MVEAMTGWCEYSAGPASDYRKLARDLLPSPAHHLGQGATSYYGIAEVARVGQGDVVFVSGAAGGVGSMAGQIARCLGAEMVIGSAGSPAKVNHLVHDLGFDAAFDYHDGPVLDHLLRLAPMGINVMFDTVGGNQLAAAIGAAVPGARFALCGTLSSQIGGQEERFTRNDLLAAATKALKLRPFGGEQYAPSVQRAWAERLKEWLDGGKVTFASTVVEVGMSDVPEALVSLLAGTYTGNVAVRLLGEGQ